MAAKKQAAGDAKRQSNGRFGAGNNANPGGRPKLAAELRERALRAVDEHVMQAWIDEVVGRDIEARNPVTGELLLDPDTDEPIMVRMRGENWVKCAELLAGYGLGKPVARIASSTADGDDAPLSVTVKFVRPKK